MYSICNDIIEKYHQVKFRDFNDRLADEPIFALAMGIMDLKPIMRKQEYYCFVPWTIKLKTDYLSRNIRYLNPGEEWCSYCVLLHWGNVNTGKAVYLTEIHKMNYQLSGKNNRIYKFFFYDLYLYYSIHRIRDVAINCSNKLRWILYQMRQKLFGRR